MIKKHKNYFELFEDDPDSKGDYYNLPRLADLMKDALTNNTNILRAIEPLVQHLSFHDLHRIYRAINLLRNGK